MKKVVVSKSKAKSKPNKCRVVGCKNFSCMMKRNHKTGEPERYCGKHWLSEVEAKRPDSYRDKGYPKYEDTLKAAKKTTKRKVKIKK